MLLNRNAIVNKAELHPHQAANLIPPRLRLVNSLRTGRRRILRLVRQEDGVEILEFIGAFPLVLLTIMIIWQFMLVGYTAIIVASAAREGARAAAVGENCQAAVVRASPGWDGGSRQIECQVGGETVVVTVRLQVPKTQLPLIGDLPGYPWVPSTAVMRYEPPY